MFTEDYFSQNIPSWDALFSVWEPKRILEIGSFEGRSTSYWIERLKDEPSGEIHCVDTWLGGEEHNEENIQMSTVEKNFKNNIDSAIREHNAKCKVQPHKGMSYRKLAEFISYSEDNAGYFDLIYIDGSHEAPDVLQDATMAFGLLRIGGVMIFDDYLWGLNEKDSTKTPKIAIDAFTNCFRNKIHLIHKMPLYQLCIQKICD